MTFKKKFFYSYYNWWKNIDKLIFTLITLLFMLGLFFSLASTSIIASDKLNTNSYYFFFKHLIFIVVSLFILIFMSFLEKPKLIKTCLILFVVVLMFLFLVPFIGIEVKGSKRWIDLGILPRFQPIELLKPFIIVSLSVLLSQTKLKSLLLKYFLSFILILPIIFLLIMQPDIGQTFLVTFIWLSLIFISGVNLIFFSFFFLILGGVLSYLIIFVSKFSYIKFRLLTFINPKTVDNYKS